MDNFGNGDENLEISQMDSAQKRDYLKALTTGRDPNTGQFLKGRPGNSKGRPRARTNLDACLNMVFAQKTNITIDGKRINTTMLQALCYKLMARVIASDDDKFILQVIKIIGPGINLNEELPQPKIGPNKKDPYYDESVEKIKKAIFNRLDRESGTYRGPDNDNPSDS